MGRPPKYKTAEELELKCNEYFKICDEHTIEKIVKGKKGKPDTILEILDPQPYTVPGLALHLGYATRFSIQDLKEHKRFSQIIKKALSKIEDQRLIGGLTRKRSEAVSIFDLKANFKYSDKVEMEITGPGGGPIAITAFPPEPEALADWERQMITARKAKQLPEKTKRS